jgi:DNA-binding MarR family transcriptional regulator
LIERQPGAQDRRINEAVITPKRRSLTDALDAAHLRLAASIIAKWSEEDFSTLARLLRRFADDLMNL